MTPALPTVPTIDCFALGRIVGPTIPALARAYLARLAAVSVTPTAVQRAALVEFFREASALLPSVKRLIVPVWGAAAANALCLATSQTITFVGTVSHANKAVQSVGGYADLLLTPTVAGLAVNACGCGYFNVDFTGSTFEVDLGARQTSGFFNDLAIYNYVSTYYGGAGTGASFAYAAAPSAGLIGMQSHAGGQRLTQTTGSGPTLLATAGTASGPLPGRSLFAMALNEGGVLSAPTVSRKHAAFFITGDLTTAAFDQFTAALYRLVTALRA